MTFEKGQFGNNIPRNYEELVSMTVFHYFGSSETIDFVIDMALDRLFNHDFGATLVEAAGKTEEDFANDVKQALKGPV